MASNDPPAPPTSLLPPLVVEDDELGEVASLMVSMSMPGIEDMLAAAKAEAAAVREEPPPFITRQTAVTVGGVHTDLVVQSFADRVFVTVTQTNKLGSMVRVSMC